MDNEKKTDMVGYWVKYAQQWDAIAENLRQKAAELDKLGRNGDVQQ